MPRGPTVAGHGAKGTKMPLCTYGAGCTRKGCIYRHPPKAKAAADPEEVCKPFLAGACQFGARCRNFHPPSDEAESWRRKYAAIPCRFAEDCQNLNCLYWHPPLTPLDSATAGMSEALDGSLYPAISTDVGTCGQMSPHEPSSQSLLEDEFVIPQGLENLPVFPSGPPGMLPQSPPSIWTQEQQHQTDRQEQQWQHWQHWQQWQQWQPQQQWRPQPEHAVSGDMGQSLPPYQQYYDPTPTGKQATFNFHADYKPTQGSWAAVAVASPPPGASAILAPEGREGPVSGVGSHAASRPVASTQFVRIPEQLWVSDVERIDAASAFQLTDPIARFEAVNAPYTHRLQTHPLPLTLASSVPTASRAPAAAVLDLHYQSVKTAAVVLDRMLGQRLASHAEVWVITGTGHHTAKDSHQRAQVGGVLHAAVEEYLRRMGHEFHAGKDRAGHSGAFLVLDRGGGR
mmetsp:Transcript_46762/g.122804  ORF Transcript_46762/g.122804 Transcript_46762/m.122804 type:complete len:456 (-) Transcript_46762:389-1756(-)